VDVDVSGDFYDAFALPDGSIALVIGDVCGKGPEAAAITALARYTIRTVAMNSSEPEEILRMLNRALLDQVSDDRFCTVAIARLRQNGGTGRAVDLVSGGHPLPVLIGGSEPRAVGEPGTLLGVVPDPALPVHTVELDGGEALVLYTDGLAAGSTTDDVGFALSVMRDVEVGTAQETIEAIEQAAISGQAAPRRDDVAIVVAELTGD
jgi:sigma-B regulation protein RsbU (phosphoserine phosphatase)